jgi:outer membrane protein assembly factor BamB
MKKAFISIIILLLMLPVAWNGKPAGAETVSKLDSTYFEEPGQLLTPLMDAISIFNGAVGTEDDKPVMYTTTKGLPAQLNVIDIKAEKLLRVIPLEGAENTWAHEVLPNGDLYIATIGGGAKLWKYSPGAEQAEVVARFSGETFPFSITADQGKIYVGTYPSGKVYQYDPANGGVEDYGRMIGESSQEYIRSLAVIGDDVYSGTGHGKIIHYNKSTGEKEDIAASIGEPGHVYDLDKVDDRYLFARYELSSNGYVYDTQEEKWLDVVIPKVRGLHVPEQSEDGKVYFMNTENKLQTFDLETLKVEDTGITYKSGFRGVDWVEFGTPDLPGKSLVTINFSGYVTILNLENKATVATPALAEGTPNVMNKIETGPDGNLYITGVQTGKGAIYDPRTKSKKSFDMGQGDSIGIFGDKLLFGVYPEGDIREFDPSLEPSDSNPKKLFTVGEEQNRISSITEGEGKAYIGSIPFYGELGGALTVYDPNASEEEKVKVYRNVVEDQSVNSLVYRDGKVYGSTTINGGLGADPTAGEARIFVWDTETEEKIKEVPLSVEGLENPEAIGELSFGPEGLLWGASIDTIFAMDPETLEIVKSRKLYDSLPLSAWNKIELEWSEGLLYADFSGNLTAIDPESLESKQIARVYDFSVGHDGNLYYSSRENRTMLHKMEVKHVSDQEKMTVTNHQFERPNDGNIPGWTSMFKTDDQAQFAVSGDEHSHGRKSLKIVDTARNKSVALMSDSIEVSEGEVFESSANLLIKEGTGSFMVRFYDAEGKTISDKPVHTDTGLNKWQNISITAEAPERAETMKVFCYTTSYAMGTVYYDKVEVKKLVFE